MPHCRKGRALALLALCLLLLLSALPPAAAAEGEKAVVRVGWHDAPFFITDQYGRRSGYAYEYQRKIAAYTGWTYEYVEGSWSELMEMLRAGEIDLLSDVSYVEERTKDMLYATLPMGTEAYYIFTAGGNTDISADDCASLNGKRVGVTRGSIQRDLFLDWAAAHGVTAELVELTGTEESSVALLGTGELDAFITLDVYGDPETTAPVCKIGSSDFYFAVSKSRPDLLAELDSAMNSIQDENRYYNQQLYEKYLRDTGTDRYLGVRELDYLAQHGAIRVGYQDNYLAFCAADPATGELTGALKDYLAYAATGLENAQLEFEPVAYPTAAAALEALKRGEVDCMFPANLSDYDGEMLGVVMTPLLMRTEMDAVVRATEQKEFIRKQDVVVAVNEGNTNYDMFLEDHYPGWQRAYFHDTAAGLKAVSAGDADCVIISNYRFSNISKICERLNLTTVYTGVDMDYCFAVREGDTALYSILARVTSLVPAATVNAALTYYSTEDAKLSLDDVLRDHLPSILTLIGVVVLVMLALLLRSIRAERRVSEEEHLVDDLKERVYVDALTSVQNKGAFSDAMDALQTRLEREGYTRFAIGVFDCDDLKKINDELGHDKGDLYLQAASALISRVFEGSPVFRVGGDEFSVLLEGEAWEEREALLKAFEEARKKVCAAARNRWEEVHISLGIAAYDPQSDRSVTDTVRRADKIMYENKRLAKLRSA